MTRSLKNSILPLLLLLIGASACTNRDDQFGNGMIPPSQQLGSAIDSGIVVNTYVTTLDSIETSVAGYYQPFVGSYIDPLVGRTDVQVYTNYSPDGFRHENYFGENPVIDSLRYGISFSSVLGDTTQVTIIDVYEVKGHRFYQDSAYFSNFQMAPYLSSQPLFSIEQKGLGVATGRIYGDLAQRLLDNTQSKENIYYNDTLFHAKFPGLYFKVRTPIVGGEGAVYQIDLSQSAMFLFYHNTGPEKPDTLQQKFWFFGDLTYDYVSFSTVQHDYSLADPSKGGVTVQEIGNLDIPSKNVYVQGLAGLMGAVRIDSVALAQLQEKVKAKGYSHIALHRAELQVTMADAGSAQYDKSFTALGMYYNILKYEFLTEYQPLLESLNTGYTSSLGGGLNRSLGTYSFDITSYVQKLLTGRESRYTTQLLPGYNYRNNLGRTRIYGSDSPYPPRLVLTYTMIK